MTIRPEEDPSYFDEFVSDELRVQLHQHTQCKKLSQETPDEDVDCLNDEDAAPAPEDA